MTVPLRLTKRARIILLLQTRQDALEESRNVVGRGQFGSRSLGYGELWHEGSYALLERLLDEMRARSRTIHFHTTRYYAKGKKWQPGMTPRKRPAELGLDWLERRLERWDVFVPRSVSENAGYLPSEAERYARPERKEFAA